MKVNDYGMTVVSKKKQIIIHTFVYLFKNTTYKAVR